MPQELQSLNPAMGSLFVSGFPVKVKIDFDRGRTLLAPQPGGGRAPRSVGRLKEMTRHTGRCPRRPRHQPLSFLRRSFPVGVRGRASTYSTILGSL